MISCLTVTREGKLEDLKRAVRCFDRQTVTERELLIVHDGGDTLELGIRSLADEYPDCRIRIERVAPGLTLGALRNLAVERASHDLVCQWDDDDLYHPRRLEVQLEQLRLQEADFCFFTDQLHYFEATGELYWDDWTVEPYPMSLIQGTMLGYRDGLGRYPDLPRGEDTAVVVDLVQRGRRIAQLSERGYLYIYVYNGRNAWDLEHHAAISAWKRMPKARLLEHEAALRSHLADYKLETTVVMMPHEDGALFIELC
jgi:glycosyltransferase involved in cell wall biosynthesis